MNMVRKKRVLIVNDTKDLGNNYDKLSFLGECCSNPKLLVSEPESLAAVVFTGGADICPIIYGEEAGTKTYQHQKRDIEEIDAFLAAANADIPMIGICRGAQLLCALTGGKLVQHVDNHTSGRHKIKLINGRRIEVNSYHHQMMLPNEDAEILGWADPPRATMYLGANDAPLPKPDKEPEIVFFPKYRAMGFQYHPESMHSDEPGVTVCQEMLERYLGIEF